ncbi:MAG: hypothetical protein N3H30_00395 [Candidatus Micrarchaeota archaeon]|nr:hypothetical protein [Candidatus Micrarchaeota archaeon]
MATKEKGNLLGSVKSDIIAGFGIISDSISSGTQLSLSKGWLLLKYLVMTFVVAFAYVMLASVPYMGHTIFIPISLLILMFHHEMLGVPASDRARLAKNAFLTAILLAVVFYLFAFAAAPPAESGGALNATVQANSSPNESAADAAPQKLGGSDGPQAQQHGASIPAIIASSLSIFLFALFAFMPVYMVKAGAQFTQAAKSSFKFISRNSMKAMSYLLLLLLSFSAISSLPAAIGLAPLSAVIFMLLGYAFFVFAYAFWERCRPA